MTTAALLSAAADKAGVHISTLEPMLCRARWSPTILAAELEREGWFARLEETLIAAYVERSVRAIGPIGAVELTDERCRELISPKLERAVQIYDGGPALCLGKTGIGKSLASRLMARKVGRRLARESIVENKDRLTDIYAAANLNIVWASATDLALAVARHPLGRGMPEEMAGASKSALLVLDDLTWPQRDDATLEVLAARYDAGKPTIATAGCTGKELVTRFGDAVVRRLMECRGVKGLLVEE